MHQAINSKTTSYIGGTEAKFGSTSHVTLERQPHQSAANKSETPRWR